MLEKILLYIKMIGITVFSLVGINALVIGVKITGVLNNLDELSINANEIIKQSKPIVKKANQLSDLALKDMKIIDGTMLKITPLLEKTNKLLDTANISMKTVNGTLNNVKPLLENTNKVMTLANNSLIKLQPTIELLKNTTSSISNVLGTTNGYLKMILGKLKF